MCFIIYNWPDSQLSINQYGFIIFSSLSGQSNILAIVVAYSSVCDKLRTRTSHFDAQGFFPYRIQKSSISVALKVVLF